MAAGGARDSRANPAGGGSAFRAYLAEAAQRLQQGISRQQRNDHGDRHRAGIARISPVHCGPIQLPSAPSIGTLPACCGPRDRPHGHDGGALVRACPFGQHRAGDRVGDQAARPAPRAARTATHIVGAWVKTIMNSASAASAVAASRTVGRCLDRRNETRTVPPPRAAMNQLDRSGDTPSCLAIAGPAPGSDHRRWSLPPPSAAGSRCGGSCGLSRSHPIPAIGAPARPPRAYGCATGLRRR